MKQLGFAHCRSAVSTAPFDFHVIFHITADNVLGAVSVFIHFLLCKMMIGLLFSASLLVRLFNLFQQIRDCEKIFPVWVPCIN